MRLSSQASGPLRGAPPLPGDKSITHRALLLAGWAKGESEIDGANPGADCRALARALEALGAECDGGDMRSLSTRWRVRGVEGSWKEPGGVLDLGNSGTAFRLLAGAVAARDVFAVLDGDASLRRRPMARIVSPLRQMGARIDGPSDASRAPLAIRGGALAGIRHRSLIASAQVKSSVLLAGLGAAGETWVEEPIRSRDHTERLLPAFGIAVRREAREGLPPAVGLVGPLTPVAASVRVPGDFSAAAFWIVAALVVPGSDLVLEKVGLNPTRTGLLEVLRRMGANLEVETTLAEGEPTGVVRARFGELTATTVEPEEVPGLVDEVPVWSVAAALATGVSRIRGAAELRGKESDRLRGVARGLSALGVVARETPDGLEIEGRGSQDGATAPLRGARIQTAGDHRLAMSFLVAGLCAREPVEVTGGEMVDTSYPGFYSILSALVSSR